MFAGSEVTLMTHGPGLMSHLIYIFYICILGLLSEATYSNSYIHSYTDGGGCDAKCRPAHQEQFGVQYLAQGHFGMQARGLEPATVW